MNTAGVIHMEGKMREKSESLDGIIPKVNEDIF